MNQHHIYSCKLELCLELSPLLTNLDNSMLYADYGTMWAASSNAAAAFAINAPLPCSTCRMMGFSALPYYHEGTPRSYDFSVILRRKTCADGISLQPSCVTTNGRNGMKSQTCIGDPCLIYWVPSSCSLPPIRSHPWIYPMTVLLNTTPKKNHFS